MCYFACFATCKFGKRSSLAHEELSLNHGSTIININLINVKISKKVVDMNRWWLLGLKCHEIAQNRQQHSNGSSGNFFGEGVHAARLPRRNSALVGCWFGCEKLKIAHRRRFFWKNGLFMPILTTFWGFFPNFDPETFLGRCSHTPPHPRGSMPAAASTFYIITGHPVVRISIKNTVMISPHNSISYSHRPRK